jgi:hypothetical protein
MQLARNVWPGGCIILFFTFALVFCFIWLHQYLIQSIQDIFHIFVMRVVDFYYFDEYIHEA